MHWGEKPFCYINPLTASRWVSSRGTVSASSVRPGKPICSIDVSLSKYVNAIVFYPSKPIIGSNIHSRKPVGASSIC